MKWHRRDANVPRRGAYKPQIDLYFKHSPRDVLVCACWEFYYLLCLLRTLVVCFWSSGAYTDFMTIFMRCEYCLSKELLDLRLFEDIEHLHLCFLHFKCRFSMPAQRLTNGETESVHRPLTTDSGI